MSGPTVHLVYPAGPRISAPHTIGRHLARALAERYAVVVHRLDSFERIRPVKGDLLLGHPHWFPGTCFRRSARQPGWARVVAMLPFNGDPGLVGHADAVIDECDALLAICGPYWYESERGGPFASWYPKMVRLDLAVDPEEFPRVKKAFAPRGRRRFVYIGNRAPAKNVGYLSELARRLPEYEFAWFGGGGSIDGLQSLGYEDFSTDSARRRVGAYDFLITVGRHDANPTTILEAMAWGLIPVCTPQSGYSGQAGIVNVPLDDAATAADVLRELQERPTGMLLEMQAANWRLLQERYSWRRFAETVCDVLERREPRPRVNAPAAARRRLRVAAWTGRNSPLRPWVLRDVIRSNLRDVLPGPLVKLLTRSRR